MISDILSHTDDSAINECISHLAKNMLFTVASDYNKVVISYLTSNSNISLVVFLIFMVLLILFHLSIPPIFNSFMFYPLTEV